jgi:hypothetical protein
MRETRFEKLPLHPTIHTDGPRKDELLRMGIFGPSQEKLQILGVGSTPKCMQ